MSKNIQVVTYNPSWPQVFETQATLIKQALQDNCVEIHHIGSTSVPGLCAKPIIDIIAVVKNGDLSIETLEKSGFVHKGEWNIPFKFCFSKREEHRINLHVFEENHPEILLNLVFRDHLRSHPESLIAYAKIKTDLLLEESSFEKPEGSLFSGYNLGKDAFIRRILAQEKYQGYRFLKVTHIQEWQDYHRIRKELIFDLTEVIYDPNHPTITLTGHHHFILCKGMETITVAHIDFLNETEAALRSLATDVPFQSQGYGREMMDLLEKWLKKQNVKILKMHANLRAEHFYRKLGYVETTFDDPCISQEYINLGKVL